MYRRTDDAGEDCQYSMDGRRRGKVRLCPSVVGVFVLSVREERMGRASVTDNTATTPTEMNTGNH